MLAHSPLQHCELHHEISFSSSSRFFTEQLVFLLFGSVGQGTKCRQPHTHAQPPFACPLSRLLSFKNNMSGCPLLLEKESGEWENATDHEWLILNMRLPS